MGFRRLFWSAALMMIVGCGSLWAMEGRAEAVVRNITMKIKLRYLRGRSRGKTFIWKLRYYSKTRLCLGSVRDKDGYATFDGSYNPRTREFRLVKTYPNRTRGRKKFYYRGRRIGKKRVVGSARFSSHFGRKYAVWTARVLFSRTSYRTKTRKLTFRGKLRYVRGGSKVFLWKLRYNPDSGVCTGRVRDRDGTAVFNGTYDRRTKRIYLVKRFLGKRQKFFYKGRFIGRGTRGSFYGSAHAKSFYGRRYARWSARRLRRNSRRRFRRRRRRFRRRRRRFRRRRRGMGKEVY